MINVSNEFKERMKKSRKFQTRAEVEFADGSSLGLTPSDFTVSNNSIVDGAGQSSLPLGVAVEKSIQLELFHKNVDYDFFGATIDLYTDFKLESGTESIYHGTFTVTTPETYGATVIVTAQDDMHKADRPFDLDIDLPISAQTLLQKVCEACGIYLKSTIIPNGVFEIASIPEGLTHRQVIGYIAMIAGGNAHIDRTNALEIIPYSFDFSDAASMHTLSEWAPNSLKLDYNDITITGVQTTRGVENTDENGNTSASDGTILNGSEGYIISVDNPLAAGKEVDLLAYLATILVGRSFRRFEGNHIAYPLAEFMDKAKIIDRRGNEYNTIITDVDFSYNGFTVLKNSAESPLRVSSTYTSPQNKAIIAARKLVQQETNNREIAMKRLENLLDNSSGMYQTSVQQPDGSSILYLHDKPTLEESQNVIKITSDAIGFSTDGGKTYPYGLTLDGDAITRILTAIGVQAEWVKVNNKTITEYVEEKVSDASDEVSRALADYANTVTASLTDLQGQIDGAIETWFYDYEPTTDNIPASNWATNDEKNKHLGDLFYIIDNEEQGGLVYRWALINGVYQWQLVEDAEVAKALETASKAQDTADSKRRVFIAQPTPPYDEGDLWTDGKDIKTCTTARAAGSQFVASDWKVLNEYASQGDVTAVKERVVKLETDNEGIHAAVSEVEKKANAAQNAIDNLEVGGRNLLAGTAEVKTVNGNGGSNQTFRPYEFTEYYKEIYSSTSGNVTCSFDYEVSEGASGNFRFQASVLMPNDSASYYLVGNIIDVSKSPKEHVVFNFTFPTNALLGRNPRPLFRLDNFNGSLTVKNAKFEEGDVATTWSPAPEDLESEVASVTERVSSFEIGIGNIEASVSKVKQDLENNYLTADETEAAIKLSESSIRSSVSQSLLESLQESMDYADSVSGKAPKSVVEYYLVSASQTGVTTSTAGWSTTVQTTSTDKPYLWHYTVTTYESGQTITSKPVIIGTHGATGLQGEQGTQGINLVLESDVEYTNSKYNINNYYLSEKVELNEYYTVTIWGKLAEEKNYFSVYIGTGNVPIVSRITEIREGVYRGIGRKTSWYDDAQEAAANILKIYAYPNSVTGVNSTITKIKFEHGSVENPIWTPAPQDLVGPQGRSVTGSTITYQVGANGTTPPTGTWSTTIPTVSAGQYLWIRTIYTYSDNTQSDPVYTVSRNGTNGRGITSVTPQYYLSTSNTTQTNGSWAATIPAYVSGRYYWTRSQIVWQNPTETTFTTAVLDNALTDANRAAFEAKDKVDNLEIGGRNLISNRPDAWEQGSFVSTSRAGAALDEMPNTTASNKQTRIRLSKLLLIPDQFTVSIAEGYKYFIYFFGEDKKYLGAGKGADGATTWISETKTFVTNSGAKYAAFALAFDDDSAIFTEEIQNVYLKLEKGNIPTDWSPAPEDADAALNEAITRVENNQTNILQEANRLTLEALTSYVTQTRLSEFAEEISARLQLESDNITASFNRANTRTIEVDGRLQEFIDEFASYIRFGADGISLGESNSPFAALLGTTRLSFTQNGREIAYISNNALYITDAYIKGTLTIGEDVPYRQYVDSNGLFVTQLA